MSTDQRISGRPIFVAGAAVVVLLAGGLGAIVGASGQERAATLDLLGVVSFGMTPTSMATFGVLFAAVVLTVLFGLVTLASRYDAEA